MDHLIFAMICLVWSSSFIVMRFASHVFGPISIAAGRVFFAACVLIPFLWVYRRNFPMRWRDVPVVLLVVLLGYLWPFTVQPYLIGSYDHSMFFGMIVSLVPLFTILVSIPLLGIKPTRRQLIGILIGLGLMTFLFVESNHRLSITWAAVALGASTPFAYACSNTLVKKRLSKLPAVVVVAAVTSFASMILVPTSFIAAVVGQSQLDQQALSDKAVNITQFPMSEVLRHNDTLQLVVAILLLVYLGAIATGLATLFFYRLIQKRGPLYAGMVTYIVPLGAVVWGWLGQEDFSASQIFLLLGIIAVVIVVQWPQRENIQTDEAILENRT